MPDAGGDLQLHRFEFAVLVKSSLTKLSAIARFFVSAKWSFMIRLTTIDRTLPSSDSLRYRSSFVLITSPDRSSQTIRSVICDVDGLVDCGVLDD